MKKLFVITLLLQVSLAQASSLDSILDNSIFNNKYQRYMLEEAKKNKASAMNLGEKSIEAALKVEKRFLPHLKANQPLKEYNYNLKLLSGAVTESCSYVREGLLWISFLSQYPDITKVNYVHGATGGPMKYMIVDEYTFAPSYLEGLHDGYETEIFQLVDVQERLANFKNSHCQ